ncbi:MAG: YdcF family protein [Pseudomonadota bacterium]
MRLAIILCIMLFGLWLAGLVAWFVPETRLLGASLEPARPETPLVMLTGGRGRIEKALALVTSGQHRRLFVSGVHRTVDLEALITFARNHTDSLRCCVELGYGAHNTHTNAIETRDWIAKNGFGSFRLLTTDYHMKRAMVEMQAIMPEIAIFPYPIESPNVDLDHWWRSPATSWLLATEYSKTLIAGLWWHMIRRPAGLGNSE